MANMSYCRFENTLADLQDCEQALAENENLSPMEARAMVRLITLCIGIAKHYGPPIVSNALFAIPETDLTLPGANP